MATVKEVIDDYNNRNKASEITRVTFKKTGNCEGYCLIRNVYRDGVKIEKLDLDTELHVYELETEFRFNENEPFEWTFHKFYGAVVDIEYKSKV